MKVIVKLQIHGSFSAASSEDVMMYKKFDLPFIPYPDLDIKHKTRKGETDYIEIKEVIWDNDNQHFECYAESDKEIYNAQLHKETHRSMNEIMQDYFDADWLSEPKYKSAITEAGKE